MSYLGLDYKDFDKNTLRKICVDIFKDTCDFSYKDNELQKNIKKSIKNSKIYHEDFLIDLNNYQIKSLNKKITISSKRTIKAAKSYVKEGFKVAALNFANGTTPGGGVRYGSLAQEESICRISTLYRIIDDESFDNDFYDYHLNNDDLLTSSRLIYSPKIKVFKTDEVLPELLSREAWFDVDIITQAAPINDDDYEINDQKMYDLFYERINNIFKAAINEDVDVLVLGAYGCGAFNNDPKIVAKAFKDVINEYYKYFKEIHFAIVKGFDDNYDIFKEVLDL